MSSFPGVKRLEQNHPFTLCEDGHPDRIKWGGRCLEEKWPATMVTVILIDICARGFPPLLSLSHRLLPREKLHFPRMAQGRAGCFLLGLCRPSVRDRSPVCSADVAAPQLPDPYSAGHQPVSPLTSALHAVDPQAPPMGKSLGTPWLAASNTHHPHLSLLRTGTSVRALCHPGWLCAELGRAYRMGASLCMT